MQCRYVYARSPKVSVPFHDPNAAEPLSRCLGNEGGLAAAFRWGKASTAALFRHVFLPNLLPMYDDINALSSRLVLFNATLSGRELAKLSMAIAQFVNGLHSSLISSLVGHSSSRSIRPVRGSTSRPNTDLQAQVAHASNPWGRPSLPWMRPPYLSYRSRV